MRTLLIDNYDSFTYNLYQYLAVTNGQLPLVVRNDAMPWEEVERLPFDNIVISPGPGRPQRPSDLGISADAIRRARVPILGVCLGHQAIAHFHGARVDLAVRPMHGRLDRIQHTAQDLFDGIPSPFEVVRYHSLAVTELPLDLEPMAWANDGTLMAFRHVAKPLWGVQFHPESICTEFGTRLLRNFLERSQRWIARNTLDDGPRFHDDVPGAPVQTAHLSLHVRELPQWADPESAFPALYGESGTAFWLDSSAPHAKRGRFSYMGDASGPRSESITYSAATRTLSIRRGHASTESAGDLFDHLAARLSAPRPGDDRLPFDFAGGYVGYFGYELKGELEGRPAHQATTPDAAWIFADRYIAFDHLWKKAWLVCLDEAEVDPRNAAWFEEQHNRLAALPAAPVATTDVPAQLTAVRWRHDMADYRRMIRQCLDAITQGESYEICLTNQLEASGSIDPLTTYRLLRRHNPAPYAAFLRFPEVCVLCASPELFVQLSRDRIVESRPIKGTAPRAQDPAADAEIARALAQDEKTRAENLMIVDLLRNDLNRVCEVGSVQVPGLFEIEGYATVHQMVSTIRGRLADHLGAIDCVKALFPGGSMTGAPKIRTMSIIDQLESSPRGVYSGSLGYLGLDGTARLNIVIRTIVVEPGRLSIGAGGAIVALSDVEQEVEEVAQKASAQWHALQACGAPDAPPHRP